MTESRQQIYAAILRDAGLDRDRADVGAIIAIRAKDTRLISCFVRAFVRDILTWNDSKVAQFLRSQDTVNTMGGY